MVDWQEVLSNGIDPPAQAGTREEVGNKKSHLVVATQAFCAIKQTIFSRLEDLLTHISYLTVIQPEVAIP